MATMKKTKDPKHIYQLELFDTDNTDPEDLEIILHHVRHGIGVE